MRFQLATTTALFALLSVSSALPAPETDGASLVSRAVDVKDGPSHDVECPARGKKVKFEKDYIIDSIKYAVDLSNDKKQEGIYPSDIKEPSSLPSMPNGAKNVEHYPILFRGGKKEIYKKGTDAGDVRVMYEHEEGKDEATYLGVWTHYGAEKGKYQKC
ncbi:hypothetical protein F4819DRAFT_360093 [Hypoxylon fuscum]|nr:hypothetical protein F4819DRAFT_360093 [Hypoxylon fuscum]